MENYECDSARQQIKKWIVEILTKSETFDKIEVDVTGTIEKGQGYVSDIVFATILTEQNGATNQRQVAVKIGKSGVTRDIVPVRSAFEREISFYANFVPSLKRFLKEKKSNNCSAQKVEEIDFVAECFGTMFSENVEIILLQNLRAIGYYLHDRIEPMNLNHVKLTLETYGKYHALSFAMQDQNPEIFHEIFENNSVAGPWQKFNESKTFTDAIVTGGDCFRQLFKDNDEMELLKLYEKRMEKGILQVWFDYADMKVQEYVLTHGDCWNSNFMFKYKNEDKSNTNPQKVCFLDFQLCQLSTPVFDLSYHLYSVCPPEILTSRSEFSRLLKIYHNSLKKNLKILGTDVEKCFSYDTFMRHWKLYSAFGIIAAVLIVPACYLDATSVEEISKMHKSGRLVKGHLQKKAQTRLVAIAKNNLELTPTL